MKNCIVPNIVEVVVGLNAPGKFVLEEVETVSKTVSETVLELGFTTDRCWIVKWVIELSEFDLGYKPWTSIKPQAFVDFVVQRTHGPVEESSELVNLIEVSHEKVWLLYVDGASNPGGLGMDIAMVP
ncbi:hypothetical protein LIER_02946 [Lithospermum erythrorhizon]|uniref:Uncharacterized protein n=1 Tax=Lithospermum erythrorhizon TaxID=34254 RepID=A0AAV3NW31_LITER